MLSGKVRCMSAPTKKIKITVSFTWKYGCFCSAGLRGQLDPTCVNGLLQLAIMLHLQQRPVITGFTLQLFLSATRCHPDHGPVLIRHTFTHKPLHYHNTLSESDPEVSLQINRTIQPGFEMYISLHLSSSSQHWVCPEGAWPTSLTFCWGQPGTRSSSPYTARNPLVSQSRRDQSCWGGKIKTKQSFSNKWIKLTPYSWLLLLCGGDQMPSLNNKLSIKLRRSGIIDVSVFFHKQQSFFNGSEFYTINYSQRAEEKETGADKMSAVRKQQAFSTAELKKTTSLTRKKLKVQSEFTFGCRLDSPECHLSGLSPFCLMWGSCPPRGCKQQGYFILTGWRGCCQGKQQKQPEVLCLTLQWRGGASWAGTVHRCVPLFAHKTIGGREAEAVNIPACDEK